MKRDLSPAAARNGATLSAVTHLFCALSVDLAAPGNGGGLACLLGTLAAAGAMALILRHVHSPGPSGRGPHHSEQQHSQKAPSPRGLARTARLRESSLPLRLSAILFCFVLLLVQLASAALSLGWLGESAAFMSLDGADPTLLLIPPALALLWCVSRGGDAVGRAASVTMKLSPALLVPILIMQIPHLRPDWLFPLPGDSPSALLSGSLRACGAVLAAFVPAWALSGEERDARPWLGRMLLTGLAAAGLILLRRMMTPTLVGPAAALRLNQLDSLLANGRAPLYLQLPMLTVWFAALLHALAFDGFTAAALLGRALPGLGRRPRAILTAAALFALAAAGFPRFANPWHVREVQAALILAACLPCVRRRMTARAPS